MILGVVLVIFLLNVARAGSLPILPEFPTFGGALKTNTNMRSSIFSLGTLLLAVFFLTTCGDVPSTSSSGEQGTEDPTVETPTTDGDETPTIAPPDCTIDGEVLEGNQLWNSQLDLLVVIKALPSEDGIISHRTLEVLDGRSCEVKFTTQLEENISPDYPYYLADIQYNSVHHFVGIQGHSHLYIFDLANDFKMTRLQPEFLQERELADAQSGMLQRLEVWESYLLGYAQDMGTFAFDLDEGTEINPILPFAEWRNTDDGQYHSLFLMASEGGGQQAILPNFDFDEDSFMINPLFQQPQALSTNVQRSARNNRFLILRGEGDASQVYPIDMKNRQVVELPQDVAGEGTQRILEWLRRNVD